MKNIAIVTGASSGMGREFVLQIAEKYKKFDEIWAIARREERLMQLQETASLPVKIIPLDLTSDECIRKLMFMLNVEKPKVRMLVNSAGCGKMGDFSTGTYEGSIGMIDLNCRALTAVTYACLPYMTNKSRILFLASSASFAPQPGFAVYAATKAYVLSFARALRQELRSKEITVTAVCPGPVDTEFFDTAGDTRKMSAIKKLSMAQPIPVVKKAIKDASMGKELSVYGTMMKGSLLASKLVPHTILVPVMNRMLNKGESTDERTDRITK